MKRFTVYLAFTTLICCCLISCKKDKPSERTVVGLWKGKFSERGAQKDWSWLLRDNMTMKVFIGSDTATATKFDGSYSKTDTTITVNYTIGNNFGITLNGVLNSNYSRIDGTDPLSGPFYLVK